VKDGIVALNTGGITVVNRHDAQVVYHFKWTEILDWRVVPGKSWNFRTGNVLKPVTISLLYNQVVIVIIIILLFN
jgi:hypothetical protein